MQNQRGFVQIPILIAVIVGSLVLGGAGYFGVKQYQISQGEKIDKEKLAQEQAQTQQEALKSAQTEIEKLKQESEAAKKKQNQLEQTVNKASTPASTNDQITSKEIAPYLDGVMQISCGDYSGSTSLWNITGIGYAALTNYHVIKHPPTSGKCMLSQDDGGLMAEVDVNHRQVWNNITDIALLPIEKVVELKASSGNIFDDPSAITNKSRLNYSISSVPKCIGKVTIGAPVVIIGFPAFGIQNVNVQGISATKASQITSNGIVSGYDESATTPLGNLPYINYFVSAKIDSGNSGGIAFSKDKNGLCVLGVPTWLTVGNYETQGLVQNIYNIFYKQ